MNDLLIGRFRQGLDFPPFSIKCPLSAYREPRVEVLPVNEHRSNDDRSKNNEDGIRG